MRELLCVAVVALALVGLWSHGRDKVPATEYESERERNGHLPAPFVPRPPDVVIPYVSEGADYQKAYDDYYQSLDEDKPRVR